MPCVQPSAWACAHMRTHEPCVHESMCLCAGAKGGGEEGGREGGRGGGGGGGPANDEGTCNALCDYRRCTAPVGIRAHRSRDAHCSVINAHSRLPRNRCNTRAAAHMACPRACAGGQSCGTLPFARSSRSTHRCAGKQTCACQRRTCAVRRAAHRASAASPTRWRGVCRRLTPPRPPSTEPASDAAV